MIKSIFSKLPIQAGIKLAFEPNETIFLQDDASSGIYFVEQGHVQLVRNSEQGERIIIHQAYANTTFAEASIFSDRYHCDAIAISSSIIQKYSKIHIIKLMEEDPHFSIMMAAEFAMQLQKNRQRLEILAIKSANKRVFSALCHGLLKGNVKHFASEISLTHEATYRALSYLVKSGKVKKMSRGIYVL